MDEPVRVWLLGGFRVSVGIRSVAEDEWRLRKAAALVKLLALAPTHRLHRERAMGALWPELDQKAAANNLHHALHVARRTLDPAPASGYLSLRDGRLGLCRGGRLWVDVEAFEEAAGSARRVREPAAYQAALELYAGELLPDDRYEEWAEGRRADLREEYLALLVELAGLYEGREDYGPAAEALQKLVAEAPAREEAHVGLMRLYAADGQRGRALDQFEQLRQALRRDLATEPSADSERLREEISAGRIPDAGPKPAVSPAEEPSGVRRHNLPAARTSFVGRERELVEAKRELAMTGLLTLTGPGGSGKTRLALEVARDLVGACPDGVWVAELGPLAEGELVPQAVASALGVREQPDRSLTETLVDALRPKKLLLLLDNCEHLVDAAARLADVLLDACPDLRILATSREPLGVAGEINRTVLPLPLPDRGRTLTVEELAGYGSARLFVERALYRPSAFALTEENAPFVAEVCRRLDGLPLAIELAAARVGALAVEQVSERLSDSLGLLTGGLRTAEPRQQTLRGSLDWSHELLVGPEKRLFRRLSVFAGGWTLEAAEAVGKAEGAEDDVPLLLFQLVDKSLVVTEEEDGEVRYRMLELVRQYARERLSGSGEARSVRSRHAGYYLTLAGRADERLRGPEQEAWLGRLRREYPNVRTALGWSLEAEPETALRLSAALGSFWYARGNVSEGRRWLEAALAKTRDREGDAARARALRFAGVFSEESGLHERAAELYEEGLALSRLLGDETGVAASLNSLSSLAYTRGELVRARDLMQESLSLKRALGDRRSVAISLSNLARITQDSGDLVGARELFEESLQMCRDLGDDRGIAIDLLNLGALAVEQGDPDRAWASLTDALHAFRRLEDAGYAVENLHALARVAGARGEGGRVAVLLGAAEAARERLGIPLKPVEQDRHERLVAASRRGTEEEAWEASWRSGRAMSIWQAAEYALSPDAEPLVPGRPDRPLTRREEEVAALVARGLTNRRIASELSISGHTAATHVRRILRKLNLTSRTQLASWTTEQR